MKRVLFAVTAAVCLLCLSVSSYAVTAETARKLANIDLSAFGYETYRVAPGVVYLDAGVAKPAYEILSAFISDEELQTDIEIDTANETAFVTGDAVSAGGKTLTVIVGGDADSDGRVTAKDARTALRISAKLQKGSENEILACDYTCDGKIEAHEARMILRASAKLTGSFLPEPPATARLMRVRTKSKATAESAEKGFTFAFYVNSVGEYEVFGLA